MKLLLGTNLFGNNPRQHIARESWMHLQKLYPELLELIAIQPQEDNVVSSFEDFTTYQDLKIPAVFNLTRFSCSYIPDSTKKIPFINDIINEIFSLAMQKEDITHFAYINSDCILTDNFMRFFNSTDMNALAISRLDIAPVELFKDLTDKGANILRNEIAGFDMFVFSKEWWTEHVDKFTDFLIGQPLFDVLYAGLIMLFGGKIYNDYTSPFVCHIFHENTSHNHTPEKKFNEDRMKTNMFEHLVVNMMHYHLQYNLCKRKPWGRFLVPEEDEATFTQNFFEIMRLDTDNQVKYIE